MKHLFLFLSLTVLMGCARTPSLSSLPESSNASGPMADDPVAALNHLRFLEYDNQVEAVLGYLATPAASEFVLKRSRAATRQNIARIQENTYGFEVLAGKASGDAGVTILRVVDLGSDQPIKITPFYVWRIGGEWHFLPNPTVVSAWYQAVPAELLGDFSQLEAWYAETVETFKDSSPEPEALLQRYWTEVMGEDAPLSN